MNEAETKLVVALRSGKYAQIRGQLHNEHGFCCLGVACDVLGDGQWDGEAYKVDDTIHSAFLPLSVIDKLNWNSCYGSVRIDAPACKGYTSLSNMNDGSRSFNEIADVIEKGLVEHKEETK